MFNVICEATMWTVFVSDNTKNHYNLPATHELDESCAAAEQQQPNNTHPNGGGRVEAGLCCMGG